MNGLKRVDVKEEGHALEWGKCCSDPAEFHLLKGKNPFLQDGRRIIEIALECGRGFWTFRSLGPCVTVFGSARFARDSPFYKLSRELGSRLSRAGYTVMTGGGPGLMEAANRGAREAGGKSVACNIKLPREQKLNAYLDQSMEVRYFFVRKLLLAKYSHAFVAMPGGFGTLDEILEILVLIQTGKMKDFPIILVGREYWAPLEKFIRNYLVTAHAIRKRDLKLLHFVDSVDEAVRTIGKITGCGCDMKGTA
jgi:uncharacterized protein (TIGR00730 family)